MSDRLIIRTTGSTGPTGSASSSSIDDLTDVTITAAASGDILRHNGTAWVDAVGTTHFEVAGAVAAHEADTTNVHGIADTSALATTAAVAAGYQPLDSDLTAIAALSTTAYGRAFLTLANQAATMALLSAASDTASGVVELATTAETTTGTDTARAVTPAGLLNATTASNINARVAVKKAGTLVAARRGVNFIEGSGVTITTADDSGNEEVDVTIAASGAGMKQAPATMSGTDFWGLPGWFIVPSGTSVSFTGSASSVFYTPIIVTDTITLTDVQVWVTVAGTAAGTNRLSLYTADSSWQPTATSGLVLDLGTVAIDSTGNKTITGLSQVLTPGRYLFRLHTDASASQPSYHYNHGGIVGGGNLSAHASAAASVYWRRSVAYGAAEANPGPWNGVSTLTSSSTATSGFFRTPFQMRWT